MQVTEKSSSRTPNRIKRRSFDVVVQTISRTYNVVVCDRSSSRTVGTHEAVILLETNNCVCSKTKRFLVSVLKIAKKIFFFFFLSSFCVDNFLHERLLRLFDQQIETRIHHVYTVVQLVNACTLSSAENQTRWKPILKTPH